jgi:hypothetical protein
MSKVININTNDVLCKGSISECTSYIRYLYLYNSSLHSQVIIKSL